MRRTALRGCACLGAVDHTDLEAFWGDLAAYYVQLTGVNAMNAMCYVVCISRSVSRLRPDGASLPRLPTHCHEDSTTIKLSGRLHMSLHALEAAGAHKPNRLHGFRVVPYQLARDRLTGSELVGGLSGCSKTPNHRGTPAQLGFRAVQSVGKSCPPWGPCSNPCVESLDVRADWGEGCKDSRIVDGLTTWGMRRVQTVGSSFVTVLCMS